MFNVYAIAAYHYHADPDRSTREIRVMLAVERAFVAFQVGKILHHSGFRRWREFFRDDAADGQGPRFCQRTPVFSYFVVRSAHLWCSEWFVRQFPRMEFPKRGHVPWMDWWDQLMMVWNSPEYEARIDQCIALNRDSVATKHNAAVYDTMRMTAHEIF